MDINELIVKFIQKEKRPTIAGATLMEKQSWRSDTLQPQDLP